MKFNALRSWRSSWLDFIAAIPADAFGPGDEFDPEDSYAMAALIRKLHEAKTRGSDSVGIWGSRNQGREFIFVDDLADACIFTMQTYQSGNMLNLGGGTNISIAELALAIKEVVQYQGDLRFDTTKPLGMPRKALDSSVILSMGWRPKTPFPIALQETYQWFLQNRSAPEPVAAGSPPPTTLKPSA